MQQNFHLFSADDDQTPTPTDPDPSSKSKFELSQANFDKDAYVCDPNTADAGSDSSIIYVPTPRPAL
ncbi:hypothetical protein B0H16DRAFT_1714505 [Mycena metata]|uniref:Uncharacterized protein n=1 Tax=Mycena metata TaxID=1033252 RepID=A0AAD7NS24_9AGAR|nr:hypothetical protein B0H16DRAFT_1714505 [Mycena metata]